MRISFNTKNLFELSDEDLDKYIDSHKNEIDDWISAYSEQDDAGLGWKNVNTWGNDSIVEEVLNCANDIRKMADVLVFISIGGSRFPAMSIIGGLNKTENKTKIVTIGNSFSARSLEESLKKLQSKSVCVFLNCKNFETVEPGIHFLIVRKFMEEKYGDEAKERIFVCGGRGKGQVFDLCNDNGYKWFQFPTNCSARYSALSAAGLLPIAVAGIDIKKVLKGANEMDVMLKSMPAKENPAARYAVARKLLYDMGYHVEFQSYYEPSLYYIGKLWQELFAENEGKNKSGILPVPCCFSEDLHAIGQFIQDGTPIFFETMLDLRDKSFSRIIEQDITQNGGFGYLGNKDYNVLSDAVYESALNAHIDGGTPCLEVKCEGYNESVFGELVYFIMYAAYISAKLFSVFPFDQPGVENYKNKMWTILGKQR